MSHWFILQTNPNCENKASGELRRLGIRVYIPKRSNTIKNRKTGEESVKFRPLMIGYLFIRVPNEVLDQRGRAPFGLIRKCQGVYDFLRTPDGFGEWVPLPIPEKPVIDFMRRQRSREFGRPDVDTAQKKQTRLQGRFKRGRQMVVAKGPFETFLATVEKLRKDGTVDATITIFGRETRMNFEEPEDALKPLAPEAEAA